MKRLKICHAHHHSLPLDADNVKQTKSHGNFQHSNTIACFIYCLWQPFWIFPFFYTGSFFKMLIFYRLISFVCSQMRHQCRFNYVESVYSIFITYMIINMTTECKNARWKNFIFLSLISCRLKISTFFTLYSIFTLPFILQLHAMSKSIAAAATWKYNKIFRIKLISWTNNICSTITTVIKHSLRRPRMSLNKLSLVVNFISVLLKSCKLITIDWS